MYKCAGLLCSFFFCFLIVGLLEELLKTVTSQCLYFQFLSGLVDNDKLIKLYRVGIVIGISFFHDEHAEVIAALLYPVAALVLFLVEIEFVTYGADALVGPYLPSYGMA